LEQLAHSDGVVVQLLELICKGWTGAEREVKAEVGAKRRVSRDAGGMLVGFDIALQHVVVYVLHSCTVFEEFF